MSDVVMKPFEAYRGREPYLFVSYAHADSALVYPEIGRLHLLGYRIWYDEGIDPATIWADEIYKALEHASIVLVFLSPNAAASEWVQREIHAAIEGFKKPAFVVHLARTELKGGAMLLLARIQVILKYQVADEEYRRALKRTLPPETIEGPPADAPALVLRGREHASRGAHPRAIVCFSEAIRLDPDHATAYYHRGIAHFQVGAYEESLADFRRAHGLDPGLRPVHREFRFRVVCWIKKYLGRWGGRRSRVTGIGP